MKTSQTTIKAIPHPNTHSARLASCLPNSPESATKFGSACTGGKIVDAVIKAIIDKTGGLHYQIDFGKEQTALISERQVAKD
jgi:hypothetical protein